MYLELRLDFVFSLTPVSFLLEYWDVVVKHMCLRLVGMQRQKVRL